jgi:hypothetical protein
MRIGTESIDRAVRLIDTFVKALLARGHRVQDDERGVGLLVNGEVFRMRISETRDRRPPVPTPAELREQSERERWRAKYPGLYSSTSKAYRTWDYYPSGRFSFELWSGDRTRWHGAESAGHWHERSTKRVEEYLNNAVVALVSTAALIKYKRDEAEEQARLRAEVAERRRREVAKLERAKKRREFLIKKASEHYELVRLAGFLDHLETQAAKDGTAGVDRITREMRVIVDGLRERLGRDALDAEIARLQFYTEEDDEPSDASPK